MKITALILIGFALLASCSTSDTEEVSTVDLSDKINQFKTEEGESLEAFADQIDGFRRKMRVDCHKPVMNENYVALDYTKGNVFQMKMNIFADSTSLGKTNRHFYDEIDLIDLCNAITNPVDSFMPKYGDEGRLKQFDALKERVLNDISNQEYLLVLYEKKRKAPRWFGATFEQGTLDARVLIYKIADQELLSVIEFSAMSSTSVSAKEFGDLGEAAEADFRKNITEAYKKALKGHFVVNGEPSYVSDTR